MGKYTTNPDGSITITETLVLDTRTMPVPSSQQEKLEVMTRITKAWLQMPDTSFMEVIREMNSTLTGLSPRISDKDFARIFEEQIERANKARIYDRIQTQIGKLLGEEGTSITIPTNKLAEIASGLEKLMEDL